MNSVAMSGKTRRVFSLLSLLMLGSILITALAVIVLGQEDMRGNAAFALIVVSVLATAAILFGYAANQRIQKVSQLSWISVALVCLAFSFHVAALDVPGAHKAADTVLLTAMFVLTFPTGTIAIVAVMAYSSQFLATRGAGAFELFTFWLLFFALGYVQWFKLVPWLSRAWTARRARSATPPT